MDNPRRWNKVKLYDHLKEGHGRKFSYSFGVFAISYLRDMHIDSHMLTVADHHHGHREKQA